MISKLLRKPIITFATGIFFGFSLFSFYAFMNKSVMPQTGQIEKVDLTSAVKFTKNYRSAALPMNSIFEGFVVDTYQLEAMNKIMKQNPASAGFRIYLGKTGRGVKNSIVVGIKSNGEDATNKTMYKTVVTNSGPCPPVCDTDSPL